MNANLEKHGESGKEKMPGAEETEHDAVQDTVQAHEQEHQHGHHDHEHDHCDHDHDECHHDHCGHTHDEGHHEHSHDGLSCECGHCHHDHTDEQQDRKIMIGRLIVSAVLLIIGLFFPEGGVWRLIFSLASALIIGYDVILAALQNILHRELLD